jgi:hypothetical protein
MTAIWRGFLGGWEDLQHNSRTYSTIQGSRAQFKDLQYNSRTYSTIQGPTVQFKDPQHNWRTYSTIQGPTAQFKDLQYNSRTYSTIQEKLRKMLQYCVRCVSLSVSNKPFFLGALKNCKKRLFALSCSSLRLPAWKWAPTERIFMKFDIRELFENISRKYNFYWNLTKITDTLHEHQHTFKIISRSFLLTMRNVSNKCCKKTHISWFFNGWTVHFELLIDYLWLNRAFWVIGWLFMVEPCILSYWLIIYGWTVHFELLIDYLLTTNALNVNFI